MSKKVIPLKTDYKPTLIKVGKRYRHIEYDYEVTIKDVKSYSISNEEDGKTYVYVIKHNDNDRVWIFEKESFKQNFKVLESLNLNTYKPKDESNDKIIVSSFIGFCLLSLFIFLIIYSIRTFS